jgi:hypothetical protein
MSRFHPYTVSTMPKRTSEAADLSHKVAKSEQWGGREARVAGEDADMGEFEDKWEDDIESDGEVVEADEGEADDGEEGVQPTAIQADFSGLHPGTRRFRGSTTSYPNVPTWNKAWTGRASRT